MIEQILFELLNYQERMRKKSKEKFRDYLFEKAKALGLEATITPKSGLAQNVVIGNLDKASVIIGAHYDTPPRMFSWMVSHPILFNIFIVVLLWGILPLIIIFMPFEIALIVYIIFIILLFSYLLGFFAIPNKNNYNDNTSGVLTLLTLMHQVKSEKIAYVFFDNEEKGLIGSLLLARHLRSSRKNVIILDCVGVGETLAFYYYGYKELANKISSSFINLDNLNYNHEVKKGGYLATSDHLSFRYHSHVGIMVMKKKGGRLTISNIHSELDNFLETDNIRYICLGISKYLEENYGIDTRLSGR